MKTRLIDEKKTEDTNKLLVRKISWVSENVRMTKFEPLLHQEDSDRQKRGFPFPNCKQMFTAFFWVLIDLMVELLVLIIEPLDNQTES